ncbi:MAG TPA: hypothetical protein VKK79_19385 [Candidatus Lokiarchaeia archaeon]|nr:hypothetical protein [Candidatus Lokiarchaeia archaeon]
MNPKKFKIGLHEHLPPAPSSSHRGQCGASVAGFACSYPASCTCTCMNTYPRHPTPFAGVIEAS